MLVQIRDRAALSSLPSTNLRHYLKTHGWKDVGQWGKRATIYTKKYGGRNWEILIPLSDTVADYAESMAESIAILSTVEDRSQLDVFYDVLKAGSGEAQELVKALNGQKQEAEEAIQKVRQNLAAFPLDRAIFEADSLLRGGEIEEAIEKWRSIANVSEGIDNELAAQAWFSVGYLLTEGDVEVAKKNNIQEAISVYDRALSLKPDFADAYTNRGTAKGMLEQPEAAIADFDRALSLKPDDAEVYYNRGSVKLFISDYEAAIADFDRAIQLNPDYIEAYSHRGIVKSVIKQPEAAIADFDRAIQLNPDYADAYYNRGILKRVLGDYEAAIADFDRAIQLNPDLFK
ncbi:MAG: tetratricopeptide repeat protein, partial [Gemmatimonadetes bacterium]|nr:tetratricopeptide repeat protein [Gemmatimonadota bacterium]